LLKLNSGRQLVNNCQTMHQRLQLLSK